MFLWSINQSQFSLLLVGSIKNCPIVQKIDAHFSLVHDRYEISLVQTN